MAINECAPCSDKCLLDAAAWSTPSFYAAVLRILCAQAQAQVPLAANLVAINGSYNGTDQEVLPAPGAGFKYKIRSLTVNTEDSETDWSLGSKVGVAATVYKTPNFDYLDKAGLVLSDNLLGWFSTDENGALVSTSNQQVDLLGVAEKVPV